MRVSIKKFPVRYSGKTYRNGDEFEIEDAHFDENLFVQLESSAEKVEEIEDAHFDEKVTKADIVERLKELDIDFDPKAKKDELAELLDQHSKE